MQDSAEPTRRAPAPVAGIVLASGLSRRFGSVNKLLRPLGGDPIVLHTVRPYLAAGLSPVLVVVGHEGDRIISALGGLDVVFVPNPDYLEGQSRSLIHGLEAVPANVHAAIIGVADQPYLTQDIIASLLTHYERGSTLVVPRYAGNHGNPVLFARSLFPELLSVTGDVGGRPVLQRHVSEITWLDISEPLPGLDIDTPEDLP